MFTKAQFIVLMFPLLAASYSFAEAGGCTTDVQKFCAGVAAGDGRIKKCLKEHKTELSAECRTSDEEIDTGGRHRRGRHHGRAGHSLKDCREDFKKYCPGIKKGRGRLQRCLKQKGRAQLSPECSAALGL